MRQTAFAVFVLTVALALALVPSGYAGAAGYTEVLFSAGVYHAQPQNTLGFDLGLGFKQPLDLPELRAPVDLYLVGSLTGPFKTDANIGISWPIPEGTLVGVHYSLKDVGINSWDFHSGIGISASTFRFTIYPSYLNRNETPAYAAEFKYGRGVYYQAKYLYRENAGYTLMFEVGVDSTNW